jgi:hypothetical protein
MAAANKGEACTDVRKWAAGDSRRKNPSGPYSAESQAFFQVGAVVGGGMGGMPSDVVLVM